MIYWDRVICRGGLRLAVWAGVMLWACTAGADGHLDDYDLDQGFVSDYLGRDIKYEFVKPPGYETAGPLPLVVQLHGSTGGFAEHRDGLSRDMADLLRATQHDNYERLTVCTVRRGCFPKKPEYTEEFAAELDEQFSSYVLVPQIRETSAYLNWLSNLDIVRDVIDEGLANYNIDPKRIYLTGYSDGGFGTYGMLDLYPDLFAAAVPIAGAYDTSAAPRFAHVPIWIFHGQSDFTVPTINALEMNAALVNAGGSPRLTILAGEGHDTAVVTYPDEENVLYPWMFSQGVVPEPGTLALGVAAVLMAAVGRRKVRRKTVAARGSSGRLASDVRCVGYLDSLPTQDASAM